MDVDMMLSLYSKRLHRGEFYGRSDDNMPEQLITTTGGRTITHEARLSVPSETRFHAGTCLRAFDKADC
jgi:hypothetical protein